MSIDADRQAALLEELRRGSAEARDQLLLMHQPRLLRMVKFRMSPRLAQRVDPADVVQEAVVQAAARLPEFLSNNTMDFYVWLRWLTKDRLTDLHREHLGAQKRDARREVHVDSVLPTASSVHLANALAGHLTSPSGAAVRAELQQTIQDGLSRLNEDEREILILRHYEQLSLDEAAQCLQISKSGAAKRHMKALRQLRSLVEPFL